jgi:predicted Rossmann fold nucleotide-binding protein DprA/Smf involved in DNA uptake
LNATYSGTILISGGAYGVDKSAERLAKELQLPILVVNAQWRLYGREAGPKRNSIIAELADVVIAFPGPTSVGTFDTVRKAKQLKKQVFEFKVKS